MGETNGQFTDGLGNVWRFRINFASIRRVKIGCGTDLNRPIPRGKQEPEPDEESLMEELDWNLILFADVVYWLLQPDLEAKEIDAKKFGEECLTPAVYPAAAKAFWEEYQNFFHSIGWTLVAEGIQRQQAAKNKMRERAVAKLDDIEDLTLKAFDANIEKTMGKLRDESKAEAG